MLPDCLLESLDWARPTMTVKDKTKEITFIFHLNGMQVDWRSQEEGKGEREGSYALTYIHGQQGRLLTLGKIILFP